MGQIDSTFIYIELTDFISNIVYRHTNIFLNILVGYPVLPQENVNRKASRK